MSLVLYVKRKLKKEKKIVMVTFWMRTVHLHSLTCRLANRDCSAYHQSIPLVSHVNYRGPEFGTMRFHPLFPKSMYKRPVHKRVYKREKITIIYNFSGPLFHVIIVTDGIIVSP
jgi:hypothetical protein